MQLKQPGVKAVCWESAFLILPIESLILYYALAMHIIVGGLTGTWIYVILLFHNLPNFDLQHCFAYTGTPPAFGRVVLKRAPSFVSGQVDFVVNCSDIRSLTEWKASSTELGGSQRSMDEGGGVSWTPGHYLSAFGGREGGAGTVSGFQSYIALTPRRLINIELFISLITFRADRRPTSHKC